LAKQWLSAAEVAQELSISIDTVRNWIKRKNGPLPAAKLGRDWRIKREDLDRYIEKRKNVRDDA
jgi:excisionase family DNA binding protein